MRPSHFSLSTLAGARAPGYAGIRIAAEWASAVRGQPLMLGADAEGNATQGEADASVRVFTSEYARRPALRSLTLEWDGAGPLTLEGPDASAVFWSESAVEKFVFPYCASLFADQAGEFLHRLCRAWYDYPDTVEVCAVVYTLGSRIPTGVLRREDALKLLCIPAGGGAELEQPRLLTLREFENEYGSAASRESRRQPARTENQPDPAPERVNPGWIIAAAVESIVGRDAAEFVSGWRDHWLWFTRQDSRLDVQVRPMDEPGAPPEETEFWGAMLSRRQRRAPRVTAMVAGIPHPVPLAAHPHSAHPDSIFWTSHAVESLLLPYYASVKGWTAPYWNVCLMGKWDGVIPPHQEDGTRAFQNLARRVSAVGGLPAADTGGESSVFAVTHLPRSEYVTETEPGIAAGLESRTVLLTVEKGAADAPSVRRWPVGGEEGQRGGTGRPASNGPNTTSRSR